MHYFFELLFHLFFISMKLLSCLDRSYLFSITGSKLNKLKKINYLKNVTDSLEFQNSNSKIFFFFMHFKSLVWNKQLILIMLVSTTIIIFKISITYNFLVSNFLYITIFNKNINVSIFLGKNIIIIKFIYYISFSLCAIYIVYSIINKIYIKKQKNTKLALNTNDKIKIKIGELIHNNKEIFLDELGLYQNILIAGSIGSGKTSSAITNILDQLIKNNLGGIVIDVKGNYYKYVDKIARKYDKTKNIIKISLDTNTIYNPLDKPNFSNIELSNMIRQVLTLTADMGNSDSFWLDKAESYIRDVIVIIRAYNEYVDFLELHRTVVDKEYLEDRIKYVKNKILNDNFSDSELFSLNSAILNIKNEYFKLDERTVGIIRSEITRMTSIFISDKKIYEKFCGKNEVFNFFTGNIIVLSINIGEHRLISKIISTYLKLEFQKEVLSQSSKYQKVFFICDEYQEFSNIEDARFFSLSREYNCINVISMQSYSSLINSLKNEYAAKVIIQNLVNKIWFRNDDIYTISEIIKYVGKKIKNNETISFSENSQNTNYNFLFNKFKTNKSGLSESYSISKKNEYTLSEEDLNQKLDTFEAICMLSDGNKIEFINKLKLKRWEE